jgi:hypothetical protein
MTYFAGNYQAEVLDQGFSKSPTKGTPYFFLHLKVLGRYDPDGKLVECPQFERTYEQYVKEQVGIRIFRKQLKSLGVEVGSLTQLFPGTPGCVSLVGRKIDVVCKMESYQGKQKERWSILESHERLDLNAVRMLDDQHRHLLQGSGQAPSPAVTTPNDTDVPF